MLTFLSFFSLAPSALSPSRFLCVRRRPWLSGLMREMLAEATATCFLMFMGACANAQLVIGQGNKGDWLANQLCWGLSIMVGVYVAGGVSGAHMNPAVTLAMAVHRGFEYYKVLGYWLAQFVGAWVGTAVAYAAYYDAVAAFENLPEGAVYFTDKSAGIFCTMEAPWLTVRGAIVDNILGTAMLLFGLCALNDARNFNPVASNLAPLLIGLLVTCICLALGMNAGAAINPVRDLPQRIVMWMFGWGRGVFTRHDNYWPIPMVCPFVGAQLGIIAYDLCVAVHHDQPSGSMLLTGESDEADVTIGAGKLTLGMAGDEDGMLGGGRPTSPGGAAGLSSGHSGGSKLPSRTGSSVSFVDVAPPTPGSINIYAVGGRASAALKEPSGMVHINEGFLDPAIKASADDTFHRKKKSQGAASANRYATMQLQKPLMGPNSSSS